MNIGNTPTELFHNLMKLAEENEAFYFADQELEVNGTVYTIRSFTYRLASWSDFQDNLHLDARESRGTAFYSKDGENWEIFCRAYPKFWNLGEGVDTKDFIKEHKPVKSFEKMDGSLILFGKIEDKVIAKSKTSINSEQAQMAQKIYENTYLYTTVNNLIEDGYTPVFELVGPDNVIVLRYDENKLVLLGTVHNKTGNIVFNYGNNKNAPKVYYYSWDELLEIKENSKDNIEGFVVFTDKGELVKVKTLKYTDLHKLKDSINNLKSLAQLILDDNVDDLIGSFRDDQETIKYIEKMQNLIGHRFNHIVNEVEKYVQENKHLDRKDFAIKTQKFYKNRMGLIMDKYLGKEPRFKEYFMKYKLYENLEVLNEDNYC